MAVPRITSIDVIVIAIFFSSLIRLIIFPARRRVSLQAVALPRKQLSLATNPPFPLEQD